MATEMSCGTGGWNGPKPGDPDNNAILKATPVYGGIEVSWTYPLVNPSAVAHVILYRGLTADFAGAARHKVVSGDSYFDRTTSDILIEYFYWIEIVSINGTIGDLIGPASATAKPTITYMLELLTGQIDADVLAQSLKTEIAKITSLGAELDSEIAARLQSNADLGVTLANVQFDSAAVTSLVQEEIATRVEIDSILTESINAISVIAGNAVASVAEERLVRIARDNIIAASVDTVEAALGADIAAAQTTLQTNINALTGEIGALYTAKVTVNGLIGGFGIYNNGNEVQAGFDVDTFWIGRTNDDKIKPFIVSDGIVYINSAAIADASITSAHIQEATIQLAHMAEASIGSAQIADVISSSSFSDTTGWSLQQDGKAIFNNVTVRGTIESSIINGTTINGGVLNGTVLNGTFLTRSTDAGDPYYTWFNIKEYAGTGVMNYWKCDGKDCANRYHQATTTMLNILPYNAGAGGVSDVLLNRRKSPNIDITFKGAFACFGREGIEHIIKIMLQDAVTKQDIQQLFYKDFRDVAQYTAVTQNGITVQTKSGTIQSAFEGGTYTGPTHITVSGTHTRSYPATSNKLRVYMLITAWRSTTSSNTGTLTITTKNHTLVG